MLDCSSTLSLQSSTTAAFVRLVGLSFATGAVVVPAALLVAAADLLVAAADLLVAARLALATASAAPATVVVTAVDPEGEDEEPELEDEEPQPASPPAMSRPAVIQMEGVRRKLLPLLSMTYAAAARPPDVPLS